MRCRGCMCNASMRAVEAEQGSRLRVGAVEGAADAAYAGEMPRKPVFLILCARTGQCDRGKARQPLADFRDGIPDLCAGVGLPPSRSGIQM